MGDGDGNGASPTGTCWCIVTAPGAGKGGRLWDRDNRSWAASVSSALRVLNMGMPPSWEMTSCLGSIRVDERSTEAGAEVSTGASPGASGVYF